MKLIHLLLLLCLVQVAFFQDDNGGRGRGRGGDDGPGDDRGGNNNNRRQCKIEWSPGNGEVRLWSGSRTLARSNNRLNDLEFDGYCNCNLYLYSQTNYRGLVLNYPFSRSPSHHIYPNRVWNRVTRSWRVICRF